MQAPSNYKQSIRLLDEKQVCITVVSDPERQNTPRQLHLTTADVIPLCVAAALPIEVDATAERHSDRFALRCR